MSEETTESNNFSVPGSDTYTVPKYVYEITIEATGGGSGGGVAVGVKAGSRGGGGGSSGSMISKTLSVKPRDTIAYTVGAGGAASSGSGAGKGADTEFTYKGTTYECNPGNVGADATSGFGGGFGAGGASHTPSDGDTNTASNAGQAGGTSTAGAGGASVSGDGYGAGGAGSGSHSSQNNAAGGNGGIKFTTKISTPNVTIPSGREYNKKNISIGGNKIAISEDNSIGKSRIQAAIISDEVALSGTTTKLWLGGLGLQTMQTSNGNYVLRVYAIGDDTDAYPPDSFKQSTDASMFRGINVDVFYATDGKYVLAFDRIENQEDLSGFGTLNSNETISNAIMWLGTPLIVNDDNAFVVSVSDSSVVDEFVTTYLMGFPFLVARQGSDYLLCVLFDDYGYESGPDDLD